MNKFTSICAVALIMVALSGCHALLIGAGAAGGVVVGKEIAEDE